MWSYHIVISMDCKYVLSSECTELNSDFARKWKQNVSLKMLVDHDDGICIAELPFLKEFNLASDSIEREW